MISSSCKQVLTPWILIAGLLIRSGFAMAQEQVETDSGHTESAWFDKSRDALTERLDNTAIWFDSFFGDPRTELTSEAGTFIRLTLDGYLSSAQDESDYRTRFYGDVRLPRAREKWRLIVSGNENSDKDIDYEVGDSFDRPTDDNDRSLDLGLRYMVKDEQRHGFDLNAGVKAHWPLDYYANARYRYTLPLSDISLFRLTETLYWENDDGFGLKSLADYEIFPNLDTMWRFSLYGDYGEETDGLEWRTQAAWMHRLNPKAAISIRAGVKGETEPEADVKEGWLTYRYRRNFLRPWLYYEVEPGLSWLRKEDYDTDYTLALRLEIQFYKD